VVTILQKNIMVLIDTVYQKVLAIANKEQRGYITPQEFNLYADQAQKDIFEQYFYDINQFERVKGNNTEYSDMLDKLNEKLSIFKKESDLTYSTDHFSLPNNIYRLGSLFYKKNIIVQEINTRDYVYLKSSPLLKPTNANPVYINIDQKLYVYPDSIDDDISCSYVRKPTSPNWPYVFIDDMPFYDDSNVVNFELHRSEENNLVNKILQLAGIMMNNELYQVASQEEIKDIQQEKS